MPIVALVIVHFRTLADTIECLESALRLEVSTEVRCRIILVDNASGDGSWEGLCEWAQRLPALWSRVGEPRVGVDDCRTQATSDGRMELVLLRAAKNGGYASGLNLGVQYAMEDPNTQQFWLLNSDLVLQERSLAYILECCGRNSLAIYGSTLLYGDDPSIVQAAGGATNVRLIGRSRHYGKRRNLSEISHEHPAFDYIVGAAMFLSREVIQRVGLFNPRWNLYFEENDYCVRARKRGVELVWVPESHVIHKEGKSTGAGGRFRRLSDLSFRLMVRNSLLFTWIYHPFALPTVLLFNLFETARYCLGGDIGKFRLTLCAIREFWEMHATFASD